MPAAHSSCLARTLLYIDEEELTKEREVKAVPQNGAVLEREPQYGVPSETSAHHEPASDRNLRLFDLCLAEGDGALHC